MIVLHLIIKLLWHKNLNNQWMSVMSCKIGEYMARRKILMNQRTSSYFKYIYIEFTTMCDYEKKRIKFLKKIDFYFVLLLCSHNVHSDSSSHFTDTAPEFHQHPDHVEFQYDAIPGPSNEKLLKSKNYKKDPSIEPSKVIYMQIKER